MFPDPALKDYLEFMKTSINGRKFPHNIFTCCLSKKHKRVNHDFAESFEGLPEGDKIHYYRKYLDISASIGNKKSKFPETLNNLDVLEAKKDEIHIRYRMNEGKKWR